jgi:hypothetical protein
MKMFRIIQVPEKYPNIIEQLGSKEKFWYQGIDGKKYLFKEGYPNSGENWCEKVVCELCALIGLPHAHYELAVWRGRKGVITPSFVPQGGSLIHGNELLAKIVSGYQSPLKYSQRQHTLGRVLGIVGLKIVKLSLEWTSFPGSPTAVDVFTGYLMLDAWIANQDRHHENWGLVLTGEKTIHLAPTYDHASGLGRNVPDLKRQAKLKTTDQKRGMDQYVKKAASAFYLSPLEKKPLSTLEAFEKAAKRRPIAAKAWLDKLSEIKNTDIRAIFEQVPQEDITETAIEFAQEILRLNQMRLLELKRELK